MIISAAPMFHIAGLNCQLVAATVMGNDDRVPAARQVAGGHAPRAESAARRHHLGARPHPALAHPRLPRPRPVRHVVGAQRRRRQRGVAAGAAAHLAGAHPHRPRRHRARLRQHRDRRSGHHPAPGRRARAHREHRAAVGDDAGAGARLRDRRGAPRGRGGRDLSARRFGVPRLLAQPRSHGQRARREPLVPHRRRGCDPRRLRAPRGSPQRPDHPRGREHLPRRDREPACSSTPRSPKSRSSASSTRSSARRWRRSSCCTLPAALTESDVQGWVAATLAGFKVPSTVEFRDDLPHNASGKVLKHLLQSPEKASDFVEET